MYRAFILFVLILGLRLGMAVLIDQSFEVSKDAEDVYSSIAENLAQGNGFVAEPGGEPILHRAPLYPLFLAGVYTLFGATNSFAVLCVQATLDAGTGLLLWKIGARLFGGTIGAIAALLFALYPLSAYYTLRMLPEPLFTLVLLILMAALIRAVTSNRPEPFLLVGVLGAVAALVKPVAVWLVPFLAFLLLVRGRQQMAPVVRQVGLLLTTFLLVLTPWTLRNYWVTGHLVPVATGGGRTLWVGNSLISDGRDNDEIEGATLAAFLQEYNAIAAPYSQDSAQPALPSHPEASQDRPSNIGYEEDRAFLLATLREIQDHPRAILGLWVRKFFRFWFDIFVSQNQWAQVYIYGLQGTLLLFAVYGIVRARQARYAIFPLLAVSVYLPLVYPFIYATLRYSIPLVPVLMLFATLGAWDVLSRLAPRLGFVFSGIPQAQ